MAEYFVDATLGDDANSGLYGAPKKSFLLAGAGVLDVAGANDTVYLKSGERWSERFIVPAATMTFDVYGGSDKPTISGGTEVVGVAGDWTEEVGVGANIWSRALATECLCVIFIKAGGSVYQYGDDEAAAASVVADYDWYWGGNKLYVYATSNPASYYSSIEAAQVETAVYCAFDDFSFNNIIAMCGGIGGGVGDVWYFTGADGEMVNCDGYFSGNQATSNIVTNHNAFDMTVSGGDFAYGKLCTGFGGVGVKTFSISNSQLRQCVRGHTASDGTDTLDKVWIDNCTNGIYVTVNTTMNVKSSIISNIVTYAFYQSGAGASSTLSKITGYNSSPVYAANGVLTMKNSILSVDDSLTFKKDAAATYVGDYNCFKQAVVGNVIIFDGVNYSAANFANYKAAAAPQDANSIAVDPQFLNGSGAYEIQSDFKLNPASPCRDKGVAIVGVTEDYEGKPVPMGSAPDIGAYEIPVSDPIGLNLGLSGGGRMIPPRRRRR